MRCDECGRFVSYNDILHDKAERVLIEPDSHFGPELYRTLCKEHKKGADGYHQM